MHEIICSRSGLKFEAETRRTKVHPGISYYTSHKNTDIRYPAIAVIEKGKAEGWDTLEKFEAEIEKALNPEPPARPDYDFEGAWVAKITGSSEKFRFERKFLDAVDTEGRFKRFQVAAAGPGIYETCYKSAKGNETRHYYQVEGGKLVEATLEQVEALFPEILPVSTEGCLAVEGSFSEGQTVEHNGQTWVVVKVDTVHHWEDEDGIGGTGKYYGSADLAWEKFVSTCYLRPATEVETATYQAAVQAKAEKQAAATRLQEIATSITVGNGATYPDSAAYPQGKEFVTRPGHFQPNQVLVLEDGCDRLWLLTYNGRDGDDWSPNNVAGAWVGCYLEIEPSLKTEIEELLTKC